MRKHEILKNIQNLFAEHEAKTLTASEIAVALDLGTGTLKRLERYLGDLVVAGDIVRVRGDRYAPGEHVDLRTGTIAVLRSGNAFLDSPDGGESVFVAKYDLGTALPGDRVVVRLMHDIPRGTSSLAHGRLRRSGKVDSPVSAKSKGLSGKVIKILERVQREIVGTLKTTGKFLYVMPIHQSYKHDFYVPDAKGANINDRVLVRFCNWENKHVSPEAEIIDVLGPADNPSLDTLSIIRHYGFTPEFPADVQEEAELVSTYMKRPGKRKDMRQSLIITIDPARSRDFDDALSVEIDDKGNRVLGVHIADVGHFVRYNSKLDIEAKARGNSVYLPDMVIPMLPEQLSNGMCSLRPDEDRLAFSAFITLDSDGQMVKRSFAKTIIRSACRLTYEEAMATISGNVPLVKELPMSVVSLLKNLNELAQQLRKRRFARYALELDMAECEIVMNDEGVMTGIRNVVNDASHQLVEECMVLANEAVAMEISENDMPLISRFHDKPSEERIGELTATLIELGYQPGDIGHRKELSKFLSSIKDDPLAYHARVAVLRSMERAVYSADKHGHFGLAKAFYSHFTSPIRRYPDLVLHRQLASWLSKQEGEKSRPVAGARTYANHDLSAVAIMCSATERKAEEAERSLIEMKKYRFLAEDLKSKNPKFYKAIVVKTSNFGMFVEVLDLQLQGLVHVSAIPGGYVQFERKDSSLRVGKQVYKVGTELEVRVVRVDMDNRKIDFVPTGAVVSRNISRSKSLSLRSGAKSRRKGHKVVARKEKKGRRHSDRKFHA